MKRIDWLENKEIVVKDLNEYECLNQEDGLAYLIRHIEIHRHPLDRLIRAKAYLSNLNVLPVHKDFINDKYINRR